MCQAHLPSEWEVRELPETHAYYRAIPEESADLPVVCFLRNPWDWYVSWYEFTKDFVLHRAKPRARRTNLWVTLFGEGTYDFRRVVTIACTRDEGNEGWEVGMRAWGVDLYTASWWLMTGLPPVRPQAGTRLAEFFPPGPEVQAAKYETFREDFTAFVERNEIPAPREFMDAIRNEAPRHASIRGPYREYYDDELRDLVGTKARHLIDQHGYDF
jgi:hypothetical protein